MANILYERLSQSIANTKTALNNIIPRFIGNTLIQGQFVEVGTDDKLKTTGFKTPYYATAEEIQQCGTKSPGASLNIARNDHVHPNTCPTPEAGNQIANRDYVDNRITPVGELGVIAGYEHTQVLTLNTVHKLTYLNSIASESVTHPLDGSVYVLQRVSEAGKYAVSFYGLYSSSVNNPVIKATVYKGSTDSITEETHIGSGGKLGLANDLRTGGSHGILTLNANDYVGVKIISDLSTTLTHKKMSFSVVKV